MDAPKHPRVTAMVLCEVLHQDPKTGQFTLRNVFSAFEAGNRPKGLPSSCLFVALDREGFEDLLHLAIELDVGDGSRPVVVLKLPTVPVRGEFAVDLTGVPIAKTGAYTVTVSHRNEVIAWKRLFEQSA